MYKKISNGRIWRRNTKPSKRFLLRSIKTNSPDTYEIHEEQTAYLTQSAQVFAKAFADDLKGQLTEKSLQGLKLEHDDFFSDSTYYETYKAVQKHMN